MPLVERRQLFQNHDKMKNMVDSVARYFATVLQIVDDDISERAPFVELCRQELHYYLALTSHGGVEHMKALMTMYEFVKHCDDLAVRMRECAVSNYNHNIDINPFTAELAYYHSDQLIDERTTCTRIDVGDMGQRLFLEVEKRALVWLDELDKVMCDSASIHRTDAASKDPGLVEMKNEVAYSIAERLTVMSHASVSDDCLSSRALEGLLNRLYEQEMPHAHAQKLKDEEVLGMLVEMASNPTGEATRYLLENDLDELRNLASYPPMELDCNKELKHSCNLERLSRAFDGDMDIEVRVAMVVFWADNSRKAVSAAKAALAQVQNWSPTEKVGSFHGTLRTDFNGKACKELMIPSMNFLNTPRCFACRQPTRRSGLSESGQRSELIIRSVWEMASRGYFMAGVVAADPVVQVTWDSIVMSRLAAKTISNERDVNRLGFRLCAFISNLYDMEGDHVRQLDNACCNLSRFSCQELEAVFDTTSDSVAFICECLTRRTRHYMTFKPNEGYKSFVTDAIGMLLPILYQRRNRVGIPTMMRSNGLLDILRTVPRVHTWRPTDGMLTLTIDDIRPAHSSTRSILDDLHANNVLVKRTGTPCSKRKITYSFDTYALWKLITDHAAFVATL
jgi:hypothetical protein